MTRRIVRGRLRRGRSRRSCVGWLPDHPREDVAQPELTALRRRADLTVPEAISTVLSRPR